MMFSEKPARLLSSLVLVLLVAACAGGGGSSKTNFYTLSAPTDLEPVVKVANAENLIIGIGPITFPPRLDRPQILIQKSPNKVELSDFDQWAEPLKNNFASVLAENLSQMTGINQAVVYPWSRAVKVDHQVAARIVRFDHDPDGVARLVARWALLADEGREIKFMQRSSYSIQIEGDSMEDTVAALSQALTELSREIALVIKSQ